MPQKFAEKRKSSLEDSGLKGGPAKKYTHQVRALKWKNSFVVSVNSASASERLCKVTTIQVDSCVQNCALDIGD